MLAMGGELGHSQAGNNNAYAQDNATSWLDWARAEPTLQNFVGKRRRCGRPIRRCGRTGS